MGGILKSSARNGWGMENGNEWLLELFVFSAILFYN